MLQNGAHQRTFVYDSLSRLTSSTNPESNWSFISGTYVPTTYTYDNDGNLTSKTEPAPNQQGTATVTLTYCYDSLNRMTGKAYTAQTCPSPSNSNPTVPPFIAAYSYDQTACHGAGACSNNGSRTGMTDQAGSEAWAYDPMGRGIVDARTTNGIGNNTSYSYNLDGSLAATG